MVATDRFLALAIDLADAAGEAIRPYFRRPIAVDDKPDLSPVTIADRAAEAAMRHLIAARFPEHGIIGEEFGPEREAAGFVYRGRRYRSLSEIARRITGTRWSGPLFFGIPPSAKGRGVPRKRGGRV